MRIVVEHVLRAHAYLRTEAPPEPWQPDADDGTFFGLLGEMIVAGLTRGNELGDLTLSFSNVLVEPSAAGPLPEGEMVAVAIRGAGDWMPERAWDREVGAAPAPFVSPDLEAAAAASDAVYAYVRQTAPDEGSITALFRRAPTGGGVGPS
jgi:hypothetical protein